MIKKEREIQETIRKILKEEGTKGNQVKVGYQKVILDKKIQRWGKEKGGLERVHPNTSIRETNSKTKN